MLPISRWPELIARTIRVAMAPHRAAWRAGEVAEQLRRANAKLIAEREEAERSHGRAIEFRNTREADLAEAFAAQQIGLVEKSERELREANRTASELLATLTDERGRHAEARQRIAILEGTKEVLDRQIELDQAIIQRYLEKELAEARNHKRRGQTRDQE